MRQVFSSRRVENVEAVAQMLRDAGIEVKVTDGQSYHGRRRTFSYRERPGNEGAPRPTVWIVRAQDQVRGREILREAGLLASTRPGESTALPSPTFTPAQLRPGGGRRMLWRAILLALIAIGLGLVWYTNRGLTADDAPLPASAPAQPVATPVDVADDAGREPFQRPVPTALAALLVQQSRFDGPAPCVMVDDAPASAAVRAALGDAAIADAGSCGPQADIRIGPWLTDGSGEGTVAVQVLDGAVVHHRAQRQGSQWRILGPTEAR